MQDILTWEWEARDRVLFRLSQLKWPLDQATSWALQTLILTIVAVFPAIRYRPWSQRQLRLERTNDKAVTMARDYDTTVVAERVTSHVQLTWQRWPEEKWHQLPVQNRTECDMLKVGDDARATRFQAHPILDAVGSPFAQSSAITKQEIKHACRQVRWDKGTRKHRLIEGG